MIDRNYFIASAVCWPGSTADVQAIVRWANQWNIPLHPISIGRNLGYGGSAPRVPGSVVIDLGRRMNKVLDINEKAATCLLQPGVTYIDLYEELKRRGLGDKLWIDVPDLGGGSVMGNCLDRGVGYTPMGDHFAAHCGMEIVLANGEVVRTGMDAMPGTNTGQSFQYGFGPYHDGIFTQSNFGICTRMGFWLMPNPGGIKPFMIVFKNKEDLVPAVDIIQPLMINRVFGVCPSLRIGLWDAANYKSKREWWPEGDDGPVPDDIEERIVQEAGIGRWVFYCALYGPDQVTTPMWEMVKEKFSVIPDVRFVLRDEAPEDSYLHDRAHVFAGVPTFRELDWHRWVPNAGELFFAPISPVSGEDALKQVESAKEVATRYGFDYLGTMYIGPREMHHIITILFDRTKPEQRKRALECIRVMVAEAAKQGYGEYRTHIALYDQVAATYNWNDGALMKLNNTLKDALDPNGILQPGRSGIWPKSYRGKGWELGMDTVVPKQASQVTKM